MYRPVSTFIFLFSVKIYDHSLKISEILQFMITVSRFPKSYIHKTTPLYIQIRILRVALDESPPRSNLVAHQHVEGFVCLHRFLDVHA